MKVIYISGSYLAHSAKLFFFKIFLLLALLPLSFSTAAQCDANFVQIGSYHIEFVGVEYDYPQSGQSTWFYTVHATSGKDISHVTFPLTESCIDFLDAGTWGNDINDLNSGQGKPNLGKDPKAKIWGIKFDKGINSGDSENYYFTLGQNLAVEPVTEVAIKAGRPFYKGTVCGPSPNCNEPSPEPEVSCISGQTFHDVNQNGIREAGENPIEGVTVTLYIETGIWGQVTTGPDGMYSFCELETQFYIVGMAAPIQYSVTLANIGLEETDSDLEIQEYTDLIFINTIGESYSNIDGGFTTSGGPLHLGSKKIDELMVWNNLFKERKIPNNDFPNTYTSSNTNSNDIVKMKIFPNPVVDQVTFKVPENNRSTKIEILDQSFKLIMTTNIDLGETETNLDLSNLPNGVYFARIVSNKKSEVKQIIKTK